MPDLRMDEGALRAIIAEHHERHGVPFALIEDLFPSPTPNADAALGVIAACNAAAEVVARAIVAAHPRMPLGEVTTLVSSELFYAAQDAAQTCALGIWTERS